MDVYPVDRISPSSSIHQPDFGEQDDIFDIDLVVTENKLEKPLQVTHENTGHTCGVNCAPTIGCRTWTCRGC